MKTFLALVLFLTVACGVEIGNCSDEPTCEDALEQVEAPSIETEPLEEVPPYDTEVENG